MFAPEGLWFIAVPAALFFLFALVAVTTRRGWWFVPSLLFMILWLGMLFFFRDPLRPLPEPTAVVSPADGTVLAVEEDARGATTIKIYLSPLNVHAIRAPLSATVTNSEFIPGEFLRADHPEAGTRNQQVHAVLQSEHGNVNLRVISGVMVRRVIVPLSPGQEIVPGERIGFVRFGSRSEITLPAPFVPAVSEGDMVIGGVTILGNWDVDPGPDETEESGVADGA